MTGLPVLFVGHPLDRTFRHTLRCAKETGLHSRVLDLPAFITHQGEVFFDFASRSGQLSWGADIIDLARVASCYLRLVDTSAKISDDETRHAAASRFAALLSVLQTARFEVVNRPYCEAGNSSKPYQTQLLRRFGFVTPETCVTNDPDTAIAFAEEHSWQVIYKSIGSTRSIVEALRQHDVERLRDVCSCSVQFQKRVRGADVRVHMVHDKLFPELIDNMSPCVDYRYAPQDRLQCHPHRIPEHIEDSCIRFRRATKLIFAGFDFKVCEQTGQYYCLEVNPSPGYNGYDERAGGAISRALLNYLVALDPS